MDNKEINSIAKSLAGSWSQKSVMVKGFPVRLKYSKDAQTLSLGGYGSFPIPKSMEEIDETFKTARLGCREFLTLYYKYHTALKELIESRGQNV